MIRVCLKSINDPWHSFKWPVLHIRLACVTFYWNFTAALTSDNCLVALFCKAHERDETTLIFLWDFHYYWCGQDNIPLSSHLVPIGMQYYKCASTSRDNYYPCGFDVGMISVLVGFCSASLITRQMRVRSSHSWGVLQKLQWWFKGPTVIASSVGKIMWHILNAFYFEEN